MMLRNILYILFLYTTLFRSYCSVNIPEIYSISLNKNIIYGFIGIKLIYVAGSRRNAFIRTDPATYISLMKSEVHTSELQARPHLVCRLLLEKKKKNN